MAAYAEENVRRGSILRNHIAFAGKLSPFLEIGANVGHTSYMLANEFGAEGFALDISADALRYGTVLQDAWQMSRAPVRVAGDAAHLPFADGSLQFVCAFQMLSQFMDIDSVFVEVKRVLAPGGVFFFSEEPLRRKLSLRLYRCPYYETMKPWERKMADWGLLGYLVRDVIGAHQEESFGIRQNHTMGLTEWDTLVRRHFAASEYEMFVPERGWGERIVKRASGGSQWRAARLLGGTLSAFCRKAGAQNGAAPVPLSEFEAYLRCPDCQHGLVRQTDQALRCNHCGYHAPNEGGVYNLLPSAERTELYPGDRADIIDFSLPAHERRLVSGFYDLEGVFGNKYRWIGGAARARLQRVKDGPQRLRIRGHAHERMFAEQQPAQVSVRLGDGPLKTWTLERPGLFVLEMDLPEQSDYDLHIEAGPTWQMPPDVRVFSVNLSMIRLVPQE